MVFLIHMYRVTLARWIASASGPWAACVTAAWQGTARSREGVAGGPAGPTVVILSGEGKRGPDPLKMRRARRLDQRSCRSAS